MNFKITKSVKEIFQKLLVYFHQKTAHTYRIEKLSSLIAEEIEKLDIEEPVRCLDVGCGDMLLSYKIQNKINFTCTWKYIDIYPLPKTLKVDNKWKNYQQFNGKVLPFENNTFDVVIICDVLHHDFKHALNLLYEAKRTSTFLIVKDHYEYGILSRTILRLMDFIGNWAYGVSVPKYYFTPKSFLKICEASDLEIKKEIRDIDLYEHSFLYSFLTKSSWQFIAVLK